MKNKTMKEWMAGVQERLARKRGSGHTYAGRSAKRAALVAAALLSCAGMSAGRVSAEGSRDIVRTSQENAAEIDPELTDVQIARWSFSAIPTQSFMGVNKQQKIKFYAYAGEVVFFASNAVADPNRDVIVTRPDGVQVQFNLTEGTNGGYIADRAHEEDGPRGIYLPDEKKNGEAQTYTQVGSGGFEPFQYPITQSGVYEVQFKADNQTNRTKKDSNGKDVDDNVDQSKSNINVIKDAKNHVTAWDITVTQPKTVGENTEYYAVNGRVWMDAIMIQTGLGVYGNLFAVTRDGYIWKFSLNGMKPYTFSMYANARGGIGTGTNASVYHSVHDYRKNNTDFGVYNDLTDKNGNPDGLLIYGPDNEKTDIDAPCHMFVNMPDITMPDDIILSEAKEVGDIESIRYDGRSGEEDTVASVQQGYVGVGGYFEVKTKDATSYRVIIDMSNMYAKDYHGKSGSTVGCTGDDSHNEEICLSTPEDISFVYYKESDSTWYSIETAVDNEGVWNRHPVNKETDGSNPDTEFPALIKEKAITDAAVLEELKKAKLGEDTENYKCLGKIMLGNAAVNGEKDRIKWNGRDQYGRILPIGSYFGGTGKGQVYAQAKGGEIHFPVGDVEGMPNGVAVWLENPPSSTKDKPTKEEYVDRASVYYNNSEKSLLRDWTGSGINNALIWNLPKEDCFVGDQWSNTLGGTTASIEDIYSSKYNLNFENMSIVGALSHMFTGEKDVLTKQACSLVDASDHGVVDIWTHVISENRKKLSQPIYLYHYGTKKIITGFVYLDTPKVGAGNGKYDKMTDDKELPEAIITAEYGDGKKKITYTTSTDTDGYYSIPVDMKRFTEAEKNVTLTVRYEDPNVTWEGEGESLVKKISTFKVSTASGGSKQKIVKSPNISVQTVNLTGTSGEAVPLKEIYAEQVGYTYVESKPVRIQKIWEPEYLKDNSMRAIFQIFGILQKDRQAGNIEDDNRFDNPQYIVYESQEMQVNESLGGVSVVDTLPKCAYAMPAGYSDGEKVQSDKIQNDQDIVYRVKEDLKGSAVESSLDKHEDYTQTNPDNTTITYDNWIYKNKISPSTFKEIVWYDLNNNGICEEEEQKIPGVTIEFFKEDETIQAVDGDIYAEERYKEFDYASQDAMEALRKKEEINEDSLKNSKDIGKIEINENDVYEFPGGLIAGRYLVRITLPEGAAYNTATYTGDGDPVLINGVPGTTDRSLITARTKERVIVTQYINIDAGNDYEARVGYGYAGGLSIRKNVDVASAGEDETIINEIEDEDFTFEIQLAEKPEGVGVVVIENEEKQKEVAKELGIPDDANLNKELPIYSCVVEAETFKLDIDNGTEIPEDKDKRIVFIENTGYPGGSRWCSVFTLKSGERITIPNIDGNTEYWLWEYDNENNQTVEGQKNGSSTKESTTDAPLTYMPKGYSLAKLVGSSKMRNGRLPSTSRTVLVNYTNVYNPMPVKAFGGDGVAAKADGRFDIEKDAEGNPIEIDTALNIVADVKIEDSRINEGTLKDGEQQRYFQGSDVFKLLIEPVNSKIGDVESQENVPLFTSAALDAPNEKDKVSGVDVEAVTAHFTDDSSATFTQAGTYTYLLREARPFYDNDVTAIPGISYATEQYRMIVHVKHEYQQLKIEKVEWQKLKKGESGDPDTWEDITKEVTDYQTTSAPKGANPIVFTNTFNPFWLDVEISGKKVLESSVSDVSLSNVDPFTFTLEPAGVKEDRSVEKYTDSIKRDTENFDVTETTLKEQPMPEGADGTGSIPIATAVSKSGTAEGDNVIFKAITFSAKNAGSDREHAAVYKYAVKEAVPEGAEEVIIDDKPRKKKDGVIYDESEQYVYIRVYKEIEDDVNGNQMQIVVAEMCDANGKPSSLGDDFIFTNKYEAETKVSLGESGLGLTLKKTIETIAEGGTGAVENRGFQAADDGVKADDFRFVLEPKDGAPEVTDGLLDYKYSDLDSEKVTSGDNTASISIPYTEGSIRFTNTGEYTYTLREINPLLKELTNYDPIIGFSYDSTVYTITIQVKNMAKPDAGSGTVYGGELTAEITNITKKVPGKEEEQLVYPTSGTPSSTEPCDGVEFVNEYSPYSESVSITGEKVLFCEDPEVKLDDFNNAFQFKLTPADSAEMNPESSTGGSFEFTSDLDQPMPDGSDKGDGLVYKIVTNDGSKVDFGKITFNLDDVDKADGGTTDNPIIYRYKVEELLADSVDGQPRNALGKDNKAIAGTCVEEVLNTDRDKDLEANERYVYFKVYNQRQDGRDHVVVTRCNSKGEDITTVTDFTITNTYKAAPKTVNLGDLIGVQKTLKNNSKDQSLPDSAKFGLAVEAVGENTPKPQKGSTTESLVTAEAKITGSSVSGDPSEQAVADFNLEGITMTFTKAGVYEYTLRELDPFLGDVVDTVPGVTYDYYRYKLIVTVENVIAENSLQVKDTKIEYSADNGTTWDNANDLPSDHALVSASTGTDKAGTVQFVNVYRGSSASLPISGYKVLEGTQQLAKGMYSFTIRADGVATLSGTGGELEYKKDDTESVPLPVKEGVTDGTTKNGANTADMDMPLARGAVDFGMLTFTDADAGESASTAKVYKYEITENMPTDAEGNPIEADSDSKIIKDGVTYDQTKKYLYIRVYKITVVNPTAADTAEQMRQTVVAEFCNEYGRTNDAVSDFTFTNVYTAPALSVSVNDLLGKQLQKNLTEKAGTFNATDSDVFGFAFYPTSYPTFDAPMPFAADGKTMIPRVIQKIKATELVSGGDKTRSKQFEIADDDVKIAFSNAGTFTYRIRELNPETDTDVKPEINTVKDVTYDTNEYTLKVVVSYNNEKGRYEITETELTDSTSKVIAKRRLVGETLEPQEIEGGGTEPDALAFNNTYTKHCLLTYDGNNQNKGTDIVYNVPAPETREVGSIEVLSSEIPAYFSRDAKQVVFVGWAEKSVIESITGILDRDDKEVLKGLDGNPNYYNYNSEFTMPEKDVTLYAIWGYDENGNGRPDVLEDTYTLMYDTNAQESGNVTVEDSTLGSIGTGELNPETDLLMGETVTLADCWPEKQDDGTTKQKLNHSDVTPEGATDPVPVVFIGWTKDKTGGIFGKEDKGKLEGNVISEYTIEALPEGEDETDYIRTVYAAWGWDTNNNGTADVLEDSYTLKYNGNAQKDEEVQHVPADETPYVTGDIVKLKDSTDGSRPTHGSVEVEGKTEPVPVAFIGWTRQQTEDIFGKDDTLPRTVDQVTFTASDITVYAAWGYDTNRNNVADILERYQLLYDENPQGGGFVGEMPSPNPIINLIPGDEVTLAGSKKDAEPEDPSNRTPRHSMVTPLGGDAKMDVAFIGWTEKKIAQIYGRNEDIASLGLITTYEIPDEPKPAGSRTCVFYAAWGWDENGNGTADVLEPKYTLQYDLNEVEGTVSGTAKSDGRLNSVQGLLDGETVPLADCSPTQNPGGTWTRSLTHTPVDDVDVLFLGWTKDKQNDIFSAQTATEDVLDLLIDTYTIEAKAGETEYTRTAYAAWGYDTNKNGVADVLEDKYALHYNGNSDGVIAASLPNDESKYVTGDHPELQGLEDPNKPQHKKVTFDGIENVSVFFLGWTAEKHAKILDKTDTMPELIKDVEFVDTDITVYALWGYDTNNNGMADVQERLILTYDPNEQGGLVRNMPTPNPVQNLIAGDKVELAVESAVAPIHDAVTEDGKSVPVAFVGWSETKIEKILGINDKSSLESPSGSPNYYSASTDPTVSIGSTFTMPDDNVTLYAIWGYDRDGNGVADVLEATYTLHYDLNALGGTVKPENSDLIKDLTDLLEGERVTLADCRPKIVGGEVEYVLTYTTGSGESDVSVVFVGWTEEENEEIYDFDDVVRLIKDRVTMGAEDKTVYAAWGYDRDGNGVADVLEETYDLIYEENPLGGTVSKMPDDSMMAGHLTGMSVALETYSETNTKPTHSNMDKGGVSTPVAFIGWTLEQTTELYTKDSQAAPVTVTQVTFQHDDIHVYASWGYDENGNGIADVLERQFTITYHGNAQESGTVSDVPERETGILPYNTIELKGQLAAPPTTDSEPLLDLSDDADAIFLGWTETQSGRIYDVSDPVQPKLGAEDKLLEGQLLLPCDEVQFVNSPDEADAAKEANPDLCAVWTKDVDLYAVWAKDANKDGIADYRQGLLTYDGNPVEGMAWNVPESEIHSLTEKDGKDVPLTVVLPKKATATNGSAVLKMEDGTEIPLPIHSDVEGKKIVFAGWTDDAGWKAGANKTIYGRTEKDTVNKLLINSVPMKKSVTVYAIWGYDENNNGTADVLEELYTLKYEENAQSVTVDGETEAGTVSGKPADVKDLLTGETVTLVDGEMVKDAGNKVIPLPTHSNLPYVGADGNVQTVPVLFVGWTKDAYKILKGSDPIPENILYGGTVGDENFKPDENGIIKVYAAWGYDTNNNDIPDVLEECRLTYDANAPGGSVDSLPDPAEHLIGGQTVTLVDGETVKDADNDVIPLPTHRPEDYEDPADGSTKSNVPVLFVGWTEKPTDHIYKAGEDMPPCVTEVEIAQKETTVYAAWGYNLNENDIPDVKESCTLVYDGNPRRTDVADAVTGLPAQETGLAYAAEVELKLVGLNGDAPKHKPVMVGGVQTAVAFIGWTREPVKELLTRSSVEPACVTSVQMLHSTVTVYAAWGLDTNNNGTADVVEERYRLVYDGDAQEGGSVSGLPLALTGLLEKDEITLQTYPDPASAPQHTDVSGKTVLFLGWTAQPNEKIYDLGDVSEKVEALLVNQLTVGDEEFPAVESDGQKTIKVYAAWSYDKNEDGIPDVWQNCRLVYDGNAPEGTVQENTIPVDTNEYKLGDPATILDKPVPVRTDMVTLDGTPTAVAFVGWTKEKTDRIYGLEDPQEDLDALMASLLKNVLIDAKQVTVYAVWGCDTNGNGTADILEERYGLIYDLSPLTGSASGAPVDGNLYLAGTTVELVQTPEPLHSAVEEKDDSADVLFLGWTAAPSTKYYRKTDAGALPEFLKEAEIKEGGTTVYAAWGLDTNHNGTADVLEENYTLTYDDNEVEGTVNASCVPAPETPFISGDTAELRPMRDVENARAHSKVTLDGAQREVLFLGWTAKPTKEIYTKESTSLPELITDVTFANRNITVYAAWGFDTNGNGKADVLERHTLRYVDNPQRQGFVGDMPEAVPNRVSGDTVTLTGHPRHSSVVENGVQTEVVFAGWTRERTTTIYSRTDTAPDTVTQVLFEADADVEVYAAWGFDTNGNGVADVLEPEYTLRYDGNPTDDTEVTGLPESVTGLLAREQVKLAEELPSHEPVDYKELKNVSVLFIGWTENVNTKIYAGGERDYVKYLQEYVVMPEGDKTLYAAWGYDLDGNHVPDVLENHYDLIYNGNARNGGSVSNMPGGSSVAGNLSGAVVELDDTAVPTHTPVNGTALVFLGWTAEPDETIYAKESESFPDLITEVTFEDSDITVYAAWGYDTNGNDKADVLESYTLTYDANVQYDGFADQLPPARDDLLYKQEVELPRGPRHSAVRPDGSAQDVDVAFVGWTEEPEELLDRDSGLPTYFETGDSYPMTDGDNTLHALWGVDANGNGTADVLETKYTLTYDGNPTDDTEVTGLPDAVGGLIYGDRVELADGSTKDADGNVIPAPKHEDVLHAQSGQTVPVLFVGWSAAPADKIFARGEKVSLLPETYTITGNVTVYAVWGYDTDNSGVPDILEDTYQLFYEDNPQESGFAGFMPENVAGFVEGEQWELSTAPIPQHSTLKRTGERMDVAFIGWTREKDPKLLERADTVPELVKDVTFEHEDITVYAVWGVDENGDGTADVLELKYSLTYDGDPVDGTAVEGYPLTVDGLIAGEQATLVDGETVTGTDGGVIALPQHADAVPDGMSESVPVLFLGWTETPNTAIYKKGDGNLVVLLADRVTIPEGGKTVYAAWGYDMDGNGTADVLEERYDLIYDGNPQKNGDVDHVPVSNRVVGNLSGAVVELDLATVPRHTDVNETDVVFIGWTLEQTKEIYTKDSPAAPVTIERVTFRNDDITVYAAWGYDTNHNGKADVLETKYTITYHANAHEDGAVSGMPGSASVSGILWGTEVTVSDAEPRLALPSGEDVLFLGWTRKQSGKIYDVSDEEPLMLGDEALAGQLIAPEDVIRVESDIHLYAAWAKDANHDGVADYLQGLLVYDGNPVEGLSGRVPAEQIHPLEVKVKLADGKSVRLPGGGAVIPLPTHSDVDGRKVAFLGWTAEPTDDIYERTDESLLPAWITSVTMAKRVTVYASWGYDDNRNGTPDVLEDLYTLTYVGNAQQGGTVNGTPEARTNLLTEERVPLVDGRTVTDADGTLIALPTHSAMDYTDAVTGEVTEDVPVLFVAWTLERTEQILAGGDDVPQGRVTEVKIEGDTEVYAAWGYDANRNAIPDVFENERLFYAANGITSDADVTGMPDPNPQTGLFDGQTVGLSSQKPAHEDVNGSKVLFLGWTTTQNTEIYEEGHNAPACVDEVVIDRRETTVYAAWAFDRNENNVPDVIEKCRLVYDGNRIVGEVSHVPEGRTDLAYLAEVSLSGAEPEHSDVNDTKVLFLGWTDTPTNVIYAKGAQAPDCIAQVRMNRAVVTVYAAWGFDENGNGIPDVREDYRLIYDGNAQSGGTVSNLPLNVTGLLSGEGGALSRRIPQHTPVVLDGKETKVVFIGWTTERTQGIYSRPDTAPVCVDSFVIADENVTVYAAWGYDTDESGRADVLEGKYSLTYEGNPISGEATGVPEDDGWYLVGEEITLETGEIAHSEVDGRAVVFLGWSLTKPEVIFEPQATAADIPETLADVQTVPALVDRVTMEEGGLTVYAVWSYAEPLEEIEVPVSLAGTKTVSAAEDQETDFTMQGGEFSFAVNPAGANPEGDPVKAAVASNHADGSIPLIDAVYRETGTYQYTIEELGDSGIPGMQYDDSVYEVTVTVTGRGREAQADVAITRNGRAAEGILFENVYKPETANVSLEGRKTLAGRDLESGEFTFVLEPVSAEVEEEVEVQNPVSAIAAGEEAETESESELVSETEPESESASETELESEPASETEPESEPAGETEPESEPASETETELEFEPAGETELESEPASETQTQTETPAQSETQTQTEAPAQSEIQAQMETPAQIETQTQPETPAQIETQPEMPAQTEVQVQTETSAQTEAQAQTETQVQTELVLACSYTPHTHTDECFDESGMLVCGYADYVVHTHNEDCYDNYGNLVCMLPELEEHQHDESCYEWKDELVCGLLEGSGHTHSDSCYTVETSLICGLEETLGHTHSNSCYTVDTTLICGLEESAGHFHDEYCYDLDGNLICGWEESPGHYHSDSCYQKDYRLVCGLEETPGHTHSDSCYERTSYLSCGQVETPAHYHDASCYLSVQQCDKPEVTLHKHKKKCYKRVYDEEKEEWTRVLSCGKLEVLEHVHGPECFTTVEVQQPAEEILLDASGEELNLDASIGMSGPEVDESGSVVTGGLQIISVEVVPTVPSSVQVPETVQAAEPETESETAQMIEADTVPETSSELVTETVQEDAEPDVQKFVRELESEIESETAQATETETESETAQATETESETIQVTETETESETVQATESETVQATESETAPETALAAESETELTEADSLDAQTGTQQIGLEEAQPSTVTETVTRALDTEEIPMPSSAETSNTAAGLFRFGAIEYTKPGVYKYRIHEKDTRTEGIVFDTAVYYAVVTVTEDTEGVLQASVELQAEKGGEVSQAVFANQYLPPMLEISIAQSVNDGPILEETQNVYAGDVITYYLTVTNTAASGSAAAKNVVVSDAIPSGLELVANSITGGGALENRVITWQVGDIPAGGSTTVSFRVTAPQLQTNIVRTNMGNTRASNSPYGANVWIGSNVVRVNVLALRPKTPDTPDSPQTEPNGQETERNTESEKETETETEKETEKKEEKETEDETEAIVPSEGGSQSAGSGTGGGASDIGAGSPNPDASAAQTGDETELAYWLMLMLSAGLVLTSGLLTSLRRKGRR